MKGVIGFFIIGLLALASGQFLNHRPFPTYSLENMPDTEFSCRDKILGGYYADVETMCQMFHICVKVAGVGVQDFRFLCPNGTAFDQDHQICAEWEDVDCDVSTLYYSSDNFDLYRIGSGFESKAVKYGEDEETFALQRAETGDVRLNREHQTQRVNQQKEQQIRKNRPQNNNYNRNNNNSDKEIFKSSSSSNFFNNRNGGKERDDDYDDNVNVNQNNDNFQRRKVLRKQNRRPVQNQNDQFNDNQQNRRPVQNNNDQQNRKPIENNSENNNNKQNYNQQSRRPAQNDYQSGNRQQQQRPIQSNDYQNNRQQNNNRQAQNNDYQNRQQSNNRPQNNNRQQTNNRPPSNDYQNQDNDYNQQNQQNVDLQKQNIEAQTYRPNRPTGFVNNFAGSSYVPTARPSTTTTLPETKNGQGQYSDNFRQNQNSPTSSYSISTPAPFRQTQQYNNPPNRQTNNGQYKPTTKAPEKETENYPQNFPKQTYNKPTENYPTTRYTQKQTENYPAQTAINRNNNQYNTQYDIPKIKSTENYPTQAPVNRNTQSNNQYNNAPKKQTENYPTQAPIKKSNNQYNNQYTNPPKSKTTETYTTQVPKVTQYNSHYDVPKIKAAKQENYPTTAFKSTDNYPAQFSKKPTTPFKQTENYPTTFAPKFNKAPSPAPFSNNNNNNYNNQNNNNNNFPSTFAPRTSSGYTQISQQTTYYNTQTNNNKNRQQQQPQFQSTPRTTSFTQYTPTVPKISSTTPVPRSNRFDETQYDDGSYNPKYDKSDDEFLKTAHSQNIASSRNEYSKSTKTAPSSTQKPHFESPRPFAASSNTPKAAEYDKSTPKSIENKNINTSSNKKIKDTSYDYAYYDTNVGSEPEYDIDTEIKKAHVQN